MLNAAREAARRSNGRFGIQRRAEAGIVLDGAALDEIETVRDQYVEATRSLGNLTEGVWRIRREVEDARIRSRNAAAALEEMRQKSPAWLHKKKVEQAQSLADAWERTAANARGRLEAHLEWRDSARRKALMLRQELHDAGQIAPDNGWFVCRTCDGEGIESSESCGHCDGAGLVQHR